MFAYIPARIGSKRIPRKNIRQLCDKPVINHVIDNLSKVTGLKGIAVSTDSEEIADIVSAYANVETLSLRASALADDNSTFMDLVKADLPRFCDHFASSKVLFVLPTAALISSDYFQQAVDLLHKHSGLVMSVKAIDNRALLALQQSENGLIPLFPENYKLPTKSLPKLFDDAGGFYGFDTLSIGDLEMFIELSPITPVVLPDEIAIDVDEELDWQKLEQNYLANKN